MRNIFPVILVKLTIAFVSLFGFSIVKAEVDLSGEYQIHSDYYPTTSFLNRTGKDGNPDRFASLETQQMNWASERWTLEKTEDGFYRIRNKWGPETGYLTRTAVQNSEGTWVPGDSVVVREIQPTWTRQKWRVVPTGDGRYRLQNAWSPETGYLSRLGVSDGNGGWKPTRETRFYSIQDWDSQRWTLLPTSLDCSWRNPESNTYVSNYYVDAKLGRYGMRGRPHTGCQSDRPIYRGQTMRVIAVDGEWLYGQNIDSGQWGWVSQLEFSEYQPESGNSLEEPTSVTTEVSEAAIRETEIGQLRVVNGDWCIKAQQVSPRTTSPVLWRCADGEDVLQMWTVHRDGRISIKVNGVNKCLYGSAYNETIGLGSCGTGIPGRWIYPQWSFDGDGKIVDPSRGYEGSSLCIGAGPSRNGSSLLLRKCNDSLAIDWTINQPITDYSVLLRHCRSRKAAARMNPFKRDYDCSGLAQALIDANGDAEAFARNLAILAFREQRQALPYKNMWEIFVVMVEAYAYSFNIVSKEITTGLCELKIGKRLPGDRELSVVAKSNSSLPSVSGTLCEGLYISLIAALDQDSTLIDQACSQNNELLCELGRSRDRRSGTYSASLLKTVNRIANETGIPGESSTVRNLAKECLRRVDTAIASGHRIGSRSDGLFLVNSKLLHPCEHVHLYFPSQRDVGEAALLRDYAIDVESRWVFQKRKTPYSRSAWYRGRPTGKRWNAAPVSSWRIGCEQWLSNPSVTPSGKQCDEFPGQSMQAGRSSGQTGTLPQPGLRGMIAANNTDEGRKLGSMYTSCAVGNREDFIVIPVTNSLISPVVQPNTFKVCGRN